MNKKFILPLIVSASAAMFAAGCGTKTVVVQSNPDAKVYSSAQELAGVVKGNMNAVNYFTIEENFRIDAKISAYGQSSDMKMEGKGSGEMQLQPEYGHFNLDMSQSSSAGNVSSKSESYISGTGANAKGYIRTNGGEWSKDTSVTGIEFDALMEQFAGKSLIESVSNGETIADIDNNGGQVNGKDTYKISARVNGDIAGASFSDSLSSLNAVTGDWSNLYADMDLYIYKDSALPAKITVDGAELLKGIMEGMGIECQVREYTGEFTINDYNNESATVLTIPDNVILEAGDTLPAATVAGVQNSTESGSLSKKESDHETTSADSSSDDYIIYDSNKRLLTESDLSSLTIEQLRLARNEISARHGRKFKDDKLQSYFNSKSWYTPVTDPDTFDENVEKYLSDIEIKNMDFIKSTEDSRNNKNVGYSDEELKQKSIAYYKAKHGNKNSDKKIIAVAEKYEYNGDGTDIHYTEIRSMGDDVVAVFLYEDDSDKNVALKYPSVQWDYYIKRSTGTGKEINWSTEEINEVDISGY